MKWKLFSVVIVLSFLLAACGTTNQEGRTGNNNTDGNVQPTRYNDDLNNNRNNVRNNRDGMMDNRDGNMNNRDGNMNNRGNRDGNITDQRNNDNNGNGNNNNNGNDRYDISKKAADKITDEIDEIDHAYVLTTKNNAYVAAAFDADNKNDNNQNNTGNNNRNTGKNKNNDNNTNRNMRNNNNNNNMGNNNNNNNMANDDRLTDKVKDQISDIVKDVDGDIDNVYVSTNPDFIDLTTNYVNDTNNGHPVRGFFDQMGDMVERLFPQNR